MDIDIAIDVDRGHWKSCKLVVTNLAEQSDWSDLGVVLATFNLVRTLGTKIMAASSPYHVLSMIRCVTY